MDFKKSIETFKELNETFETAAPLTNSGMQKTIPTFVDSTKIDDHKCGSCSMRIPGPDGKGRCTIMEGQIDLKKGVCAFWAEGGPSKDSDIHEARMDKNLAGYVETKSPDAKIQCGTCRFFENNYCKLWQGSVKPEQCCMTYDSKVLKS